MVWGLECVFFDVGSWEGIHQDLSDGQILTAQASAGRGFLPHKFSCGGGEVGEVLAGMELQDGLSHGER